MRLDLDRLAIDKIDTPRQQAFQRLLEVYKARKIIVLFCELDQEINIAARRVEIAACSRTENLQPTHMKAAAQVPQLLAMQCNIGDHRPLQAGIEYSTACLDAPYAGITKGGHYIVDLRLHLGYLVNEGLYIALDGRQAPVVYIIYSDFEVR